jgi:predicted dehydrogenase
MVTQHKVKIMPKKRRTGARWKPGVAAGALLAAAPVFAQDLKAADRIRLGSIGVGGQGSYLLGRAREVGKKPEVNAEVVAASDIFEPRKQACRAAGVPDVYHEWERIIERKDLHGVLIATPDHWHAPMTLAAFQSGKDVYCEKPMTRTWQEAKEVYATALRTKRLFQIGAQGCSDPAWHQAKKVREAGGHGPLVWTSTSVARNSLVGEWDYYPIHWDATEKTLDWDRFLGSAPKIPFSRENLERYFRWRKYWDYSGGIATDLFYHALSHNLIVLGGELPTRVVSDGSIFHHNRDVPDTHCVLAEFPSGNVLVMPGCMVNDTHMTEAVRGHWGTTYGGQLRPEPAFGDKPKPPIPPEPRPDHMENFLRCIRTREEPACSGRAAYATMVVVGLSVESYRLQRALRFDPQREELVTQYSPKDYVR